MFQRKGYNPATRQEEEETMKKERKFQSKLSLSRETLRSLNDLPLEQVAGGAITAFCTVTQCSNCRNCSLAC
jgi:hypothetical protein